MGTWFAFPKMEGGKVAVGAGLFLAAIIVANGAGAAGKLLPGAATVQTWFAKKP